MKDFRCAVCLLLLAVLTCMDEGMILKGYQAFSRKGSSQLPPVVLLHGLLGSSRNFGSWSNRLGEALQDNHDIYAIDLRHHAGSIQCVDDTLDYQIMADDVYATIRSLNLDSVHIVGHSMGGKVAAMMALRDQHSPNRIVESLTMLDISPVAYDARAFSEVSGTLDILRTVDDAAKVQSRESVLKLLAALLPDDSLRLFVQSNMIWNDRQLRWNFNLDVLRNNVVHVAGFPYPLGDAAGRLRTSAYQGPALVLKGGNSHFVQPEHNSETTALFPNAQVRSIGGAGHWLHIDRPQESAQAVAEFIRSVAAGSTAIDAGVDSTSAQSWLASAASCAEGLVSAA